MRRRTGARGSGPPQTPRPPPPPRSALDRALPALLVAATHYPFAAFLALDERTSTQLCACSVVAAVVAASRASARRDPDPPSLRVGKYAPVETLVLLAMGSYATSASAMTLKSALGGAAFRTLAAGGVFHLLASISHVAAGAGHAAAHVATLLGCALHALVVLKSLVWHFLPPAAPPPPGE